MTLRLVTGTIRLVRAIMAVVLLAVAPWGQVRSAELTPFRVGIAAPTVNMLPLWIARDAGLFRARGLDVEVVDTQGGSRGLAEVGSGRLQAMMVGLSAVLDANAKGGDYRLIGSGANTMSFRFFGARGVGAAAALKGKRVGVSTFGSESDSAATMALKRLGLTRKDVAIVEAGGTPQRLQALKSGGLAGTALNEPADTEAKLSGLPLLVDLKQDVPWIFTAIAVDHSRLAAQPAQFREFLKAWIEGVHLALSDGRQAKAILAHEFAGFSSAALDAAYEDFRARAPRDAEPSRAGAELMLRELPHDRSKARLDDYIDTSLLMQIRREGFLDDMTRRYGRR